ncbi:MAG: AmmeMemoRadiSam system radical SAM enzyme [Promethearchaeota archaeon]
MNISKIPAPFIREGLLQKASADGRSSICLTCEHRCVLHTGGVGFCGTRVNHQGKIHTFVYGCISSLSFNPIEKKPLFHFHPGSTAITIGTYGCNFTCFWCQNHEISHPDLPINSFLNASRYIPPESLVEKAIRHHCEGTSISFNEPTLLLEYALDLFPLARKAGLYNTFVTNGYMTTEALKKLAENGLDAMNIDIKGDKNAVKTHCNADSGKVWKNIIIAKKLGIHVEITILLVENVNTDRSVLESIMARIVAELGAETPVHLNRFFPMFKSTSMGYVRPTPLNLMYEARDLAIRLGLKHVYLGNIPETKFETTTCPSCNKIVIIRHKFGVEMKNIDRQGNCIYCGHEICRV